MLLHGLYRWLHRHAGVPNRDYVPPMGRLVLFFLLIPVGVRADLPLDVTRHGIVYRVPGMAKVSVRKDIRLTGAPGFDLYRPAGKPAARLPVVVFITLSPCFSVHGTK